jgi:hypothetical protein
MVLQGAIGVGGTWVRTPVYVFALQGSCLGVWKVKDSDLQAICVTVNAQVSWGNVLGGRKGIKSRDQELADASSSVEACCEAGKNSSVERVIQLQVLAKPGNELGSVWLPLLPPGRRWGEPISSLEHSV